MYQYDNHNLDVTSENSQLNLSMRQLHKKYTIKDNGNQIKKSVYG
jgi:hypothetical protein